MLPPCWGGKFLSARFEANALQVLAVILIDTDLAIYDSE
jgi:hypothetical protein